MTYSPNLGRWLQQDPIGLEVDTNPYRYVGNNPTNATDPLGLQEEKTSAGVLELVRDNKPDISFAKIGDIPKTKPQYEFFFRVKFNITDEKCSGFIVQHVVIIKHILQPKKEPERIEFWEAWEVTEGKTIWMGYKKDGEKGNTDTFRGYIDGTNLNTKGVYRMFGYAKFVADKKIDWKVGTVPISKLPSTDQKPEWWTDKDTVFHEMSWAWDFVPDTKAKSVFALITKVGGEPAK